MSSSKSVKTYASIEEFVNGVDRGVLDEIIRDWVAQMRAWYDCD